MNWRTSIEAWVRDACIAEVHAEKPGNVSPSQRFEDINLDAFLRSAHAIAPAIATVASTVDADAESTVGKAVFSAIAATRQVVDSNTNLGIVLLITPLAAVPQNGSLSAGIGSVLDTLTVDDAVHAFEAIRLAAPSGLGEVPAEDIAERPTVTLTECMRLAADRDLIAAQYISGFHDVLNVGTSWLQQTSDWPLEKQQWRLAWVALNLMAKYGDSLVHRKCGEAASAEVSARATAVLDSGWPHSTAAMVTYKEFDTYLRQDGHRRNPGTSADMIAAILFASLREGMIESTDEGRGFCFPNAGTAFNRS